MERKRRVDSFQIAHEEGKPMEGDPETVARQVINKPFRSEKSIKNYFYMTLRKSLRRVTKMIGVKNSTDQNR